MVLFLFGVLSIALGVNLSLKEVHSATGSMYMQTPATAIKGKTVDIAVRINPGGALVDTVTATVGFDPTKFAYSRVSFVDSPFSTQMPTKVTNNSVMVTSSRLGGTVDADSLVAIMSFTPRNYETKFQADFSLSGNAAYAGTATDPASTNHTFAFTQPSTTNIPTNPLETIFSPTNSSGGTGGATGSDSPLAAVTPEDGAAVYNGAQILLKSSNLVAQARNITPGYLILIGAGFVLMCVTFALLAHYRKRHEEFLRLQAHMNLVRM